MNEYIIILLFFIIIIKLIIEIMIRDYKLDRYNRKLLELNYIKDSDLKEFLNIYEMNFRQYFKNKYMNYEK